MTCEQYQELISSMLDGELTPAEQAELEQHLSGCAECAALYGVFSGLSASLAADLVEPPASLSENVMASVRREGVLRRNLRRPRTTAVVATAACLTLAVGLALGTGLLQPSHQAATGDQESPNLAAVSTLPEHNAQSETETSAEAAAPAERAVDGESSAADSSAATGDSGSTGGSSGTSAGEGGGSTGGSETEPGPTPPDYIPSVNRSIVSRGAVMADGVMQFDFSDCVSAELLMDFLRGSPAAREPLPTELLCRVAVADGGALWCYISDNALVYRISDGAFYQADCSWEALESFLVRSSRD